MTKILYSPASPYSGKVRMAAAYAGLPFQSEVVVTGDEPEILINANPLGKIPVLIPEEGDAIFDSRTITHWIDRQSGGKLFPADPVQRSAAERLEALADGVCDSLLAQVYEVRLRPEEKRHQPIIDLHRRKVDRSLDHLEASLPEIPERIHAGHIALRALLAYLEIRFTGQWQAGRPGLASWGERFDRQFPQLLEYAPRIA